MTVEDLRNNSYDPLQWEDRVVDQATGNVLVGGTPVNETNLNRFESGMMLSHYDIGMAVMVALQLANENGIELEKLVNQRLVQSQETITNSDTGYFRTSDAFVSVSIPGFAQINAPDYDVLLTPISASDMGRVGELEAYDKTQNGFKVKMSGSASTITFRWTVVNPNV